MANVAFVIYWCGDNQYPAITAPQIKITLIISWSQGATTKNGILGRAVYVRTGRIWIWRWGGGQKTSSASPKRRAPQTAVCVDLYLCFFQQVMVRFLGVLLEALTEMSTCSYSTKPVNSALLCAGWKMNSWQTKS